MSVLLKGLLTRGVAVGRRSGVNKGIGLAGGSGSRGGTRVRGCGQSNSCGRWLCRRLSFSTGNSRLRYQR